MNSFWSRVTNSASKGVKVILVTKRKIISMQKELNEINWKFIRETPA